MIGASLLDGLRRLLPPSGFRDADAVRLMDAGRHPGNLGAGVVVMPASTEEAAAVVRLCRAHGAAVVPQGGRTGLVGGCISSPGEVVLSSARLNRIVEVDPDSRVAVVEAGVTLGELQEAARPHRLEPGIDLPSQGSATIGGMVSTNAGGIMAFRNGVMRHQVLGMQAVLPDGTIYSDLARVVKQAAGYDLKHLLIGAEGTLGFVTHVAVKLEVQPEAELTALFGLTSVSAVLGIVRRVLGTGSGQLRAAEAMWRPLFDLTAREHGFEEAGIDRRLPIYLFLKLGGSDEGKLREALESLFAFAAESDPAVCGVIAESAAQEARLWRLRDELSFIYRTYPSAPAYDVSVPVSRMDAYVDSIVPGLSRIEPGLEPFLFGHLADGNIHILLNRAGPLPPAMSDAVEACLYAGLAAFGGSFSAEHGIGTKRVAALRRYGDAGKVALMQAVKRALDGDGLFNPGKVLPVTGRSERSTRPRSGELAAE